MADTPNEAPTPAPADASVATPTNTNPEPAQAPEQPTVDLGLTPEQAEKFKTFISNSGGFDNAFKKLKTDVSQPKGAETPVEAPQAPAEPKNDAQPVPQPTMPKIPEGALPRKDLEIKRYFKDLSEEPAYANISKEIANGDYLKEMADLGIQIEVADGYYNDAKIRKYLNLKSQTVPAKPTDTAPDASAAPTVSYTEVGEGGIKNIEEAYKILMEPGSPHRAKAEEFIKNIYNKK